jgi:hypothetical protein
MIVFLQLTTAGVDSGPFDLYSNLDTYSEPFEENVSRDLLIAGYSTDVPDYATVVRITSKENCISSVDITLRDVECDLAGYVELPCNVDIVSTVTTDPDNIPGDNGTATIVFEGGTAPFIYTLNSVEQGAAVSPLVINGLSASTSYTVEIIDSYLCNDSATFTLGESTFYFDADYIMLTYEFTDGLDLDTKTRMAIPDIGQDVPADYLGFLQTIGTSVLQWPPLPATPILTFGGDNQGTGFESVLIDIKQFKIDYPLETSFTIDARCLWYRPDDIGVNPVNVAATLWKGGTPVQDGCYEGQYYCWTNPTANNSSNIDSVGIVITSTNRICGQRAATLIYNLVTKIGVLNNNDTATPTVC